MLADYHVHTELCQHAEGKAYAFRARAVVLALRGVAAVFYLLFVA